MTEPHVISALVDKRAELSGKSLALDRQKAALRLQIQYIDGALALFGYKAPPRDIRPVRPKLNMFRKRELPTFLRELERDGLSGLTNRDAAIKLMRDRGWNASDAELLARVTNSVRGAKHWQERKQTRV